MLVGYRDCSCELYSGQHARTLACGGLAGTVLAFGVATGTPENTNRRLTMECQSWVLRGCQLGEVGEVMGRRKVRNLSVITGEARGCI